MAVIRCPNCGKPNPEFLEVCQYCETPLPGGGSIRPPAGDDVTLIRPPVWDDPAPSGPASASEPAAEAPSGPATPEAASDENQPDWMAQLRVRSEAEALPDEPDWMWTGAAADAVPPPPPPAPGAAPAIEPEDTDTTDLPAWLTDLGSTDTSPSPPLTPPADLPLWLQTGILPDLPDLPDTPADVTLPPRPKRKMTDWLNANKAESASPPPAPSGPASPAAPAEPTPPPSAPAISSGPLSSQPAADADLPDWLQKLRGGLAETPPPAASSTSEAANRGTGTAGLGARSRQQELPASMRPKTGEPLVNRQANVQPPATGADSGEMPSWLRDILTAQTAPPAKSAPLAAPPAEAAPTPSVPSTPAAPEPQAAPPAAETLPASSPLDSTPDRPKVKKMTDWVGSVAGRPAEPAADGDVLPSWLQSLSAEVAGTGELDAAQAEAAEPAPGASALPEPAAAEQETMPDWLRQAAPSSDEAQPIDTGLPTGDMPAWMTQLEPPEPVAGTQTPDPFMEPAAPAEPAPPDALPDWLMAMAPSSEVPAAPVDAATPIESAPPSAGSPVDAHAAGDTPALGDDMPDWLRHLTPLESAAPAEAPPSPPPSELQTLLAADKPDFLRSMQPGDSTASAEPGPGAADEDLPEWLKSLGDSAFASPAQFADTADADTTLVGRPAAPPPAAAVPAAASPAAPIAPADRPSEPANIAAWLASLTQGETGEALEAGPEGAEPAEDELAWLSAGKQAGSPAPGAAETAEMPAEAGAMPDWLRSLRGLDAGAAGLAENAAVAESAAAAPDSGPSASSEAAGLQTSSLPDWLAAMRPIDIARPGASEADSYEETLGVLAGMRGVLRAEPAVAQLHTATPATAPLAISAAHASHAQLLADLARADATPRTARSVPARMAALAERWIIFAVLALAIWLAQFQFPGLFPLPATISPETRATFNIVSALRPGKPALMAFDYDAAQQGELNPGASVLVSHLLARGVPVAAISLVPTGAGVAQQVLSSAAAVAAQSGATSTYGSQYLNLGYVAGGPVGLLQFAASPRAMLGDDFTGAFRGPGNPLWAAPAIRNVQQLSDFGLIVLVSGSPEDTRAWIEQAQSFAPDVPTVALVSASAEPMVRPYFEAAGSPLDGLIVGLGGAAQYERQAGLAGEAGTRWPALGGGLLAAAVIIALGGLVSALLGGLGAVSRRTKTKKKR